MAATALRRVQRAARHAGRAVSRRRTPVLTAALIAGTVLAVTATGLTIEANQGPDHGPQPHSIGQRIAPGWHGRGPGPSDGRDRN